MAGFIEGKNRREQLLLPDCLDDYVAENNPVRVVDVFIDELDLGGLGFAAAAATGRPGYSPATMLKLYLMATSTRCSRADGWSVRRAATSS
jgi:transposase